MTRGTHITSALLFVSLAHGQVQLGEDIPGLAPNSLMGQAVAASADGSVMACGVAGDMNAGNYAGAVRVYVWDGAAWNQRGDALLGEAANDFAGTSVALNAAGTIVAFGAQNNDGNGAESGHVRVYTWDGNAWTQRGEDIDGEAANDMCFSVSLSDDGATVAVGAAMNNGGGVQSGHARVFTWNGSVWVQKGADINGAADSQFLGRALSLSANGDRLAVGAGGANSLGTNTGLVQVMEWDGESWELMGEPIVGVAANDVFGSSVDLSADGSTVACAAYLNDDGGLNAGHVRVFTWNGSAWEQRGLALTGEQGQSNFGWSVGLSATGERLAVGAPYYNGSFQSEGRVYMHEWNGAEWVLIGAASGAEADDRSGHAVGLSADGGTLVASALGNNDGGTDAGSVRVYCYPPTLNAPTDVEACDTFILPALNNGGYFTDAGGGGTPIAAGTEITVPQVIYAYAEGVHCDAQAVFEVALSTTPVAIIIASNNDLSTPTPGTAYQWINCGSGTPIPDAVQAEYTAEANGAYAVVVYNASCADTSECVEVLTTDAGTVDRAGAMRVITDVASRTVRVTDPSASNGTSVRIVDVTGRCVAQERMTGNAVEIVLTKAGAYCISFLGPEGHARNVRVLMP